MKRVLVLAGALLLLVLAGSAVASTISLVEARQVAVTVAYERKGEQSGLGMKYGVEGCHRIGARWAKCRTYYTKFGGKYRGEYFKCEFWTFVTDRSGRYEYATGGTSCHHARHWA